MRPLVVLLYCVVAVPRCSVHAAETGPRGINSAATNLDGAGVLVGMVENFRAGKFNYDAAFLTLPNVIPTDVFDGTSPSTAGIGQGIAPLVDPLFDRAVNVAAIISGTDALGPQYRGVAPGAALYSSSIAAADFDGSLAINRMILRAPPLALSGERARVINLSYGYLLQGGPIEFTDGNSNLSKFIDWSARRYDVTHVVAWSNRDRDPMPTAPSDNYNGITVASSEVNLLSPFFRFAAINNDPRESDGFDALGTRTSIDILAPGAFVEGLSPNSENPKLLFGASFAAPHVTGTIALLQQYAKDRITAGDPAFHFQRSRRHEVMKAVVLNSADKLDGVHASKRNIEDNQGNVWTQMLASMDDTVPLDEQIGVGHLNAERAIEQFRGGESGPGAIGDAGWDLGTTGGVGDQFSYAFSANVAAGDYISITLCWDRIVDVTSANNTYSAGDQFFNRSVEDSVSNLNLYLMPAGETNLALAVAKSVSLDDNVEHIYTNQHGGGTFDIIVVDEGYPFSASDGPVGNSINRATDFAVAWWSYEPSSLMPGDYDRDGDVDQADYTVFTSGYGQQVFPGRGADGNLDGFVNAADYTVWRDARGFPATSTTVPEPVANLLIALAAVGSAIINSRGSRRRGPAGAQATGTADGGDATCDA
ncbi:MAG: S8 family serine peptidase [Lacipirellulaceae bacterium]